LSDTRIYDVIIIGAGLAGLSAAHRVMLSGRSALVLEASQKVGGKIKSDHIDGTTIEYGGQWISSNHQEMLQLVRDQGLKLEPQMNQGKHIFADKGKPSYFEGDFPGPSLVDRLNVQRLKRSLKKRSESIDPENPWNSRLARLDQLSFIRFIKHHLFASRGMRLIKPILEARFMSGMEQVSAMEGIVQWSGLHNVTRFQIIGGADQVANKLAWEVDIAFGHEVTQISRVKNHLIVTSRKSAFKCRKVVVALAPYQAAKLRYTPSISSSKIRFWKSVETGRILKCNIIFERPWWRNSDWSGEAFLSEEYAFQYLVDSGTATQEAGVLSTYTIGARCAATDKLTSMQLEELILNQVHQIIGSAVSEKPVSFSLEDWKSPPNGDGAYTTIPPGMLTMYGELIAKNEGSIYWASAEYDTKFRGTMEGAVRSGVAAAEKVLTMYSQR